jgi:hypothetical protein
MLPDDSLPAIKRYDGVFFRVLRKRAQQARVEPQDIVIVSPAFGLICGDQTVPQHSLAPGTWQHYQLDQDRVYKMREKNLQFLREKLSKGNYTEIYINVGKSLRSLIQGFEDFTHCNIIDSTGTGIGPKARHMILWLLSPPSRTKEM